MSLILALAGIAVTTSFEGGSIGKVELISESHLRCAVKGQSDQQGRNRQANWYYFRLDNLPRREIRIELTDLVGEYNFKPGSHAVTRNTRPVYSYDNINWQHFGDESVEWDEAQVRLNLRFTPTKERMWIAHIPPYTLAHLTVLLGEIAKSPAVKRESAGKTTQGRDLPLLTVTDPSTPDSSKRVIWMMARQHAWETGTSWVMEGALRFLISQAPDAARLRREFIWKFFPMADPDGAVNGEVRFNPKGYDVNRNWDTADAGRTAEIWAMKEAMLHWIDSGHRIDLFLAMHNMESGDYIDGPPGEIAQRFFTELQKTPSFQSQPGLRQSVSGVKVDRGRMTVNQALFHERKVQAFLMEMGVEKNARLGRLRTTDDNLQFGGQLLRAMAASVQSQPAH